MTSNVNHWSYPCAGNAGNPLANLTSLAQARGGYYPMGANGLWHGGVHFDQGTAGTFDQSSVRCIADGEVIAYRIDEQYPISEYTGEIPLIKRALFSTGFVLVRHRLALPSLHLAPASDASEPALTFYSLYMHLQDWAGYQAQASLPRPDFWGEGIYCVETQGSDLNVRAEPSQSASILAALPKGTRVKVGASNGQFRKLLSIVSGAARPALTPADGEGILPGYLAFKFLKAQSEPKAKGSVVVLDQPVPIKAGGLIGHLGRYQNHDEAMPQPLLHLELFSCDDVPAFVAQSRAYASRLPETQKTLLKVYKGASKLIPHRQGIGADNPPRLSDEGVMVGVDLVLPQSLLDSLPADAKLVVTASTGDMSCSPETRWWRLDNLLADKDGQPISGWLAEQEMITTRHSPWEWEGYDFIEDRERPAGALAYHLEALRRLIDSERASYKGMIDQSDKGPVKQRLYAILDGNDDQKVTPEEIRTALGKPWHAQSIAQLITKHESEWLWNPDKWDELDELMEHSPADPNLDWTEEKKRIEKLSWWKELGGKHGISEDGESWHIHAMMLIDNFKTKRGNACTKCGKQIAITYEFLRRICGNSAEDGFVRDFALHADGLFERYGVNSCAQITHLLAQAKHETKRFTAFRESLYYSSYSAQSLYNMAPTAINNGFSRNGLTFPNHAAKLQYIEDHLLKNDAGYGQHCFGSNEYPGNDYRGRGLLHLTHYANYHACALAIGKPIDAEPILVQSDTSVIIETGLWFWKTNNLKIYAESIDLTDDEAVEKITRVINGGAKGLAERIQFKREITDVFVELYGACSS
ncbi:glycoside hydrolase family 19 protein [Pseudomonas sp. YJ42]|uniref:glycoside hydrolase family 19 protein n=1 Tax=Pseudomonas sp. YJ42 TaxID=3392115 RepID=UPI0039A2AF5F